MKSYFNLLILISTFLLVQGCNTLYNSKRIQIEIVKPGKFIFPASYKNVAVRYNNSNVSYNPVFAQYVRFGERLTDTTNIDSIAAEIYFQAFEYALKQQHFFDSVIEFTPGNYSGKVFIDANQSEKIDSTEQANSKATTNKTRILGQMLTQFPGTNTADSDTIIVRPETGIYTKEQLQQIADSTQADLLISLDYFGSIDVLSYLSQFYYGERYVLTQGIWNLYDLKLLTLEYSGNRTDTVSWDCDGQFAKEIERNLPPRKDAILNAAEISGAKIADMIVPHWSQEERLYYSSDHWELKKTAPLIQDGQWLEAAKIWKANIDNPNKSIAAKCMYNMGLACEMEGNVDAAIDWVVKSYKIFGQKNTLNAQNCQDYLRILGTRKSDLKRIEYQLNPTLLLDEAEK